MEKFSLVDETLGYVTASDQTNSDKRLLAAGSQNVLVDRNRKVVTRKGYSRLGVFNTALTPIRSGVTWNNSTGGELPVRSYDDELEVYLGTVDGTAINAWTRVKDSWSTTETLRFTTYWDTGENLDSLVFVQGDTNLYEWNGGVAIVDSVGANSVTKTGTATFAQNRFFTVRNLTFTCVRTGTDYTYTGGAGTTTLTGISSTAGLLAGDTLVQKVVTHSNLPASGRNNDTIFTFENQLVVGSNDDNEQYISKNVLSSNTFAFTFSSPRISGEGALLALDGPSKGGGSLGGIIVLFAGTSSVFTAQYNEITVGSTLSETLKVKKLDAGINQAALRPECILQVSNSMFYVSNEPALRVFDTPDNINGLNPRTLSNPIKPDFDAEDFTGAFLFWHKNAVLLSAPANSHLYILEFVEDADGKTRRFWDAPQILPVGAMVSFQGDLYGHSNSVPETYKLFDTFSDISSDDDKLPINAIAAYVYNNYGDRETLKNFDEYFVEGEISPQTNDLLTTLNYDVSGATQTIEKTIDGTDSDILVAPISSLSLAQQSLAQSPLGGSLSAPLDTSKFRVVFEVPKEDFHEIQAIFSTNEVDRYWSILAHGANAKFSRRRDNVIRK